MKKPMQVSGVYLFAYHPGTKLALKTDQWIWPPHSNSVLNPDWSLVYAYQGDREHVTFDFDPAEFYSKIKQLRIVGEQFGFPKPYQELLPHNPFPDRVPNLDLGSLRKFLKDPGSLKPELGSSRTFYVKTLKVSELIKNK
jgi:hypothetical protein